MKLEQDSGFIIRPVENEQEMDAVYRLVHDAYVWRNYTEPQPDGRLRHYSHLDNIPETTVLVATENGQIVGTVSFTLDGTNGVHVDSDFHELVNGVRREGRRFGSSWRIATIREYRHERHLVMALQDAIIRCWIDQRVETVLFTFNPRHEAFYKRILGFETIAHDFGTVDGLQNAPAILMRWDIERCLPKWLDTPARMQFHQDMLAHKIELIAI